MTKSHTKTKIEEVMRLILNSKTDLSLDYVQETIKMQLNQIALSAIDKARSNVLQLLYDEENKYK